MSGGELSPTQQTELSDTSSDAAELLRNFISTYETFPELWNPTNPNYRNKNRRNAACDKLLSILARLKPGATRIDVKRKINTLRSNYRKELNKVLASKRTGSSHVYQPTSWVFYALQFLGKYEESVNIHEQGDEIPSEEQVQDETLDEQSQLGAQIAARLSILPPPQKRRRAIGPLARQNKLLQKACSFLDQLRESPDNMPTIAKAWGERLLTLDPQQRALAEKAVNDVLFEASQGTLHRHSVKINEDPRLEATLQKPLPNNSQSHNSVSSRNIPYKSPSRDEDADTHSTNFRA